ncbi:hypothetical protein H0A36_26605 [Endozoicomonas sp. SM1973]|uniref:Uncharacterized protein n=1 Tax=Spartinivicinus marinus TaxID=2994442 RepID=A0A853I6P9_9GAMM|nr:hypothetical protein [Spartinivicinus marinus]MCX4030352.1 hypothetical protein [Spartinivicinus marinus]MCX4030479.1 hypothetical protein [Spartinivicinus marinus]NYZ69590.1 hypothetical protein [Spartinivicinus marinus]
MAVRCEGPITFTDIATEFKGNKPFSLSQYYRGKSLVPDAPSNAKIATTGVIAFSQFYCSANQVIKRISSAVVNGTNADAWFTPGERQASCILIVNPGVYVTGHGGADRHGGGHGNAGGTGMNVNMAHFPGGLTLEVYGHIWGGGGGGAGANYRHSYTGGHGGTGIVVNHGTLRLKVHPGGSVVGGGGGGGSSRENKNDGGGGGQPYGGRGRGEYHSGAGRGSLYGPGHGTDYRWESCRTHGRGEERTCSNKRNYSGAGGAVGHHGAGGNRGSSGGRAGAATAGSVQWL